MEFKRVDYERNLLASLLQSERAFYENRSKLQKSLFSDDMIRWMYIKIVQYYQVKNHTGLPSWDYFRDELKKKGVDDVKIVEFDRLFRSLREVNLKDLNNPDYYVSILHKLHLVRSDLAPAFEEIVERLEQGQIDEGIQRFIEAAGAVQTEFEETPIVRSEAITNFDNRLKAYYDKRDNPEEYKGFSTGIWELDKLTGGVQRGEFAAVMAPTAGGKSIELLNVGAVNVIKGNNVLYFTLEMPYIQVETRLDSRLMSIEYSKFKKTTLSEEEIKRWAGKYQNLRERQNDGKIGRFDIVDIPQGTPIEVIDAEIRLKIQEGHPPDIVIIDYAGIMGSQKRFGDQWERHNDNAMRLKGLARRYKRAGTDLPMFAVWTAYQLKDLKAAQKGVTTDDLALARRIADHLDLLIALIRSEEDELEGVMRIPVVKYRDGGGITIVVRPDFSTMRIEERQYDDSSENSKSDNDEGFEVG